MSHKNNRRQHFLGTQSFIYHVPRHTHGDLSCDAPARASPFCAARRPLSPTLHVLPSHARIFSNIRSLMPELVLVILRRSSAESFFCHSATRQQSQSCLVLVPPSLQRFRLEAYDFFLLLHHTKFNIPMNKVCL